MKPPLAKKRTLSEDWLAALLGIYLVFIFASGVSVPSPVYGWKSFDDLISKILVIANLISILKQFFLVFFVTAIATYVSKKSLKSLLWPLTVVFVVAQIALIAAGNSTIKSYNIEAVIISLLLGLAISHLVKLPAEWKEALSSEWYVKVGLVLLGTTIIFSDVLKAGSLGLLQAVVVVFSVWYASYWICKRFKLDDELTFMLSSAVSICGVSAAIATAGAIKGDPKKLSYVISLVLITAIPMMIGMPYLAHYYGLSERVTGAWLGGTIDTTGAVVAAGSLAGETALKISTIVKFSQNVLLGLAAFAISVYWTYTKTENSSEGRPFAIIWERFPKFVLGFILASILFSFAFHPTAVIKDSLKSMQTLWFVLAFIIIGLETKFSDIFNSQNQRPAISFLLAQFFNIVITLIIALLLFG